MNYQESLEELYNKKNIKKELQMLDKKKSDEKAIAVSWICSKGDIYLLKYMMKLNLKFDDIIVEPFKNEIFPKALSYTEKYNRYLNEFLIELLGLERREFLLNVVVVNFFKNNDYENIKKIQSWYNFTIKRNAFKNF